MLKGIFLFLILASVLYCKECNSYTDSKENIILSKIEPNFKITYNYKEEKNKKLGQDIYDDYKKTEKNLKTQLNKFLVPNFMSKSFKIDLDLEKVNKFKIAYIYTPQEIAGLNIKVEWDKQIKVSSSFKKELDISNMINSVSGIITNTFIPE